MNPIKIRPATVHDGSAIARLTTELGYRATVADITHRLTGLLRDRNQFVAVATIASEIAGWIAAERRVLLESGERGEIVGLVMSRGYRRTGVGKDLVRAAESWLASRGIERVVVRSNITRNASHPFYESIGYERTKTQHAYVKPIGPGHE